MDSSFWWAKMTQSISSNDSYISYFALLALFCFILTLVFSGIITKKINSGSEHGFKSVMYYLLGISYTVFVTVISLFPLLGMFGTVRALLGLDLSGDLDIIKQSFFDALTSTAWGIIFASVFKLLNAFIQTFAETQLEKVRNTENSLL